MRTFLAILATTFYFASLLPLQAQYFAIDSKSTLTISGTSSMHDWESVSNEITGGADVTLNANNIENISTFKLSTPVKSIKSGKNKMDNLTYEALKEKSNKDISFTMTSVEKVEGDVIYVNGKLRIAGVTNNVKLKGTYTATSKSISIEGNYKIDMTKYDVEPPTAMFGTIKVGKDVTVTYKIIMVV